jgi:shikimate dehydrogenase
VSELPGRLVLLGHPVSHSLSPVFQNAALAAANIGVRYEALDIAPDQVSETLALAKQGHWFGNVTVPHKERVFSTCTDLSPVAERVGAVNTFRASSSGVVGHNTDVEGMQAAIVHLLKRVPSRTVFGVLGAGGAAGAALAAISEWPDCSAILVNRSSDRRAALAGRFRSIVHEGDADDIARHAQVVINATSLGLRPDDPYPIPLDRIPPTAAVLDLVYSRNETRFVRDARARGHVAADGLRMLVEQGAAAFAWWFGREPDREVMWSAVSRPGVPTDS